MTLYIHEVATASSSRNRLRMPTVDGDIDRRRRLRSASQIMARRDIQNIASRREKQIEDQDRYIHQRSKFRPSLNFDKAHDSDHAAVLIIARPRPWHRTATP